MCFDRVLDLNVGCNCNDYFVGLLMYAIENAIHKTIRFDPIEFVRPVVYNFKCIIISCYSQPDF